MWELISAALSNMGSEIMKNPMLSAGKSLYDKAMTANDPSIDPYKPQQEIVYNSDGSLKAPEPNPYATLLSAASQPSQQQPVPAPTLQPLPYSPPPQPVQNLGMTPSPANNRLYRQAYGRYF